MLLKQLNRQRNCEGSSAVCIIRKLLEVGMIENATFTSIWDGGFAITTGCKVNMETKEVFDIQINHDTADMVSSLDEEYVIIGGNRHSATSIDMRKGDEYWYAFE